LFLQALACGYSSVIGKVKMRRDAKRFIVRAHEMLTRFVELERAIHEFAVTVSQGECFQ
jgi:hypothetical protein